MEYEWDDKKLALNLENHKVHFELAEQFDWSVAMVESDTREDYGESRFQAYGPIGDRLHCLVFTPRGACIRIISLRKANTREVKHYVAKTQNTH